MNDSSMVVERVKKCTTLADIRTVLEGCENKVGVYKMMWDSYKSLCTFWESLSNSSRPRTEFRSEIFKFCADTGVDFFFGSCISYLLVSNDSEIEDIYHRCLSLSDEICMGEYDDVEHSKELDINSMSLCYAFTGCNFLDGEPESVSAYIDEVNYKPATSTIYYVRALIRVHKIIGMISSYLGYTRSDTDLKDLVKDFIDDAEVQKMSAVEYAMLEAFLCDICKVLPFNRVDVLSPVDILSPSVGKSDDVKVDEGISASDESAGSAPTSEPFVGSMSYNILNGYTLDVKYGENGELLSFKLHK